MGLSNQKHTPTAGAEKETAKQDDGGKTSGKDFYVFERQYSPTDSYEFDRQYSPNESYTFERQLTPNDNDFCGNEQWESTLLAEALKVSSNPAITCVRYHRKGTRRLTDDYKVSRTVLGKGVTGEVVLVSSKHDGREYALKRFQKTQLSDEQMKHLSREVQICLSVDHPGIAQVYDVYDTHNDTCLIMECCKGGELFDRLEKKRRYEEQLAADTALHMLRAVSYLHQHRIVHRDIKLENFLYESAADDAALKLIDFGFAKVWDPSTLMKARCGSIAYVSPDVLKGDGYTAQCDVWSIGVVVFMLLSGYPPFHGTDSQISAKIKKEKPNIYASRWKFVSAEAQDFVGTLLDKDPCSRPTAQTALQHPWLTNNAIQADPHIQLSCTVLLSLRTYMCSSKLRRTILQLLALELSPYQTTDLRAIFLQLDRNSKGTISLADLKEVICGMHEERSVPSSAVAEGTTMQFIAELCNVLDDNGDQQLYYTQFLAAASQTSLPLHAEALRKVFHRLDRDCSGTISACDLCQAFGEKYTVNSATILCEPEVTLDTHEEITFDALSRMFEHSDAVPGLQPQSAKCNDTFMMSGIEQSLLGL